MEFTSIMDLLNINIELFWILGVIAVTSGLVIGRRFLVKWGYLKEKNLNDAKAITQIVRFVVSNMKFEDVKSKDRFLLITNLAEIAIDQVKILIDTNDKARILESSNATVLDILKELKIELTEDEKIFVKETLELIIDQTNL